jgi:hypothetical protein
MLWMCRFDWFVPEPGNRKVSDEHQDIEEQQTAALHDPEDYTESDPERDQTIQALLLKLIEHETSPFQLTQGEPNGHSTALCWSTGLAIKSAC